MTHTDSVAVRGLDLRTMRALTFSTADLRSPIIKEMEVDLDRLISSIASKYEDKSCPMLHKDELIGECSIKRVKALNSGVLRGTHPTKGGKYIKTRAEAFKYAKTIFNNHVKGTVAKWRMTQKRGSKKDDEMVDINAYSKNVDISADNEEIGLQIKDERSGWTDASSFIDEHAKYFTPLQILIIRELDTASKRTLFYTQLSSYTSKKVGSNSLKFDIKSEHYAAGIGISVDLYEENLTQIQIKMREIMSNNSSDIQYNQAISKLEQAFGVIIPHSIDKVKVRRLLTVAARDQFTKVESDPSLKEALETVGAKVPEVHGGALACYGVLHQKNNRLCIVCGLRKSCEAEAKNFGLGDITLSPKLLGTKQSRIPVIVSDDEEAAGCVLTERDEEIYSFLCDNFKKAKYHNSMAFKHPDDNEILFIFEYSDKFMLRVNKPASELQPSLDKVGNNFYIKSSSSVAEVIEIMNQHAHSKFVN